VVPYSESGQELCPKNFGEINNEYISVQQVRNKYRICYIIARKCIILKDKACYFALKIMAFETDLKINIFL
jgi:hypothetical protein